MDSSAGQPITITVPVPGFLSSTALIPIPAATPEVAMRLCPQACPMPATISITCRFLQANDATSEKTKQNTRQGIVLTEHCDDWSSASYKRKGMRFQKKHDQKHKETAGRFESSLQFVTPLH